MTARDALAAMRERAEAATEGPWEETASGIRASAGVEYLVMSIRSEADAEFIAHARTDLPALLDVVEAVLELADSIERARSMRVEMSTDMIHNRLTGALSKLEGR